MTGNLVGGRVAVLSDVHGNVYALEAVLRDVRDQGCDALVVAGDLAAHGPAPVETVDLLRGLDALIVRGNTDRYLAEGEGSSPPGRGPDQAASLRWTREQLGEERLRFLGRLPPSASLDGCLVVHASPGDDERGIWPDTPDEEIRTHEWRGTILCGHTHHPFHRHVAGGQIVNAGSVGWPLDGDPRPSYVVLERGPDGHELPWRVSLRRVDYDRGRPLAELERRRVPWQLVVRHYIETATWRSEMSGVEGSS
jgi:predicted phosphodiesterase